jgi:hypothetical protein
MIPDSIPDSIPEKNPLIYLLSFRFSHLEGNLNLKKRIFCQPNQNKQHASDKMERVKYGRPDYDNYYSQNPVKTAYYG